MKFSVEWLWELTGLKQPVEELARELTRIGLAVDAVDGRGDDTVLDVDVPSNRPDCLGHRGVARELSVALGVSLKPLDIEVPPETGSTNTSVAVSIDDPALCTRYSARRVSGMRVDVAPDWMRRRLERSDVRPLNIIVDITNYVLLETGQPLHAFDQQRLEGNCLTVRTARSGESLNTLDGVERKLSTDHLVIADARRPVALAGVMGGLDSEIRSDTRALIIESARFDPLAVRRTARGLGMRTEGSQRFERGTDPEGTLVAADRAATLMAQLAGGQIDTHCIDLYPGRVSPRRLLLRHERVEALLGMSIPADEMRRVLEGLGFRLLGAEDSHLEVEVPSYRADVECEEDLVEEVARHHGYDRIPTSLPEPRDSAPETAENRHNRLPGLLASLHAHGFIEGISTVFVKSTANQLLRDDDVTSVRLINPLTETGDELRCSLLPGLLASLRRNLNHGATGVALYEVGTVFFAHDPGTKPHEEQRLALVMAGARTSSNWDRNKTRADLFDVKGALEEGFEIAGWPELTTRPGNVSWLKPERCAQLWCGDRVIGWLGELHPGLTSAMDIDSGVMTAEISLDELDRIRYSLPRFRPIPRTPPVSRDLALVMPRQQAFGEVASVIRALDRRIVHVEPFDRYESKQLGPDHLSLALRVTYHHPERTLVSEEVQELEERILSQLRERFSIRLRGT